MQLTLLLALAALLPAVFAFPSQPEDDQLDRWINEQLGRSQETKNEDSGVENVGHASPGHAQEHDDFMTAFFQNQNSEEDFDAYTMEEEDSNNNAENYIADFFGDNSKADAQNDMKEENANVENEKSNDEAEEEDDDWYWPEESEAQFQIFNEGEGYILSEDFNDFPDLNIFADVQDSGVPECEEWKQRIEAEQAKVNAIGKRLQEKMNELNETSERYDEEQKKIEIECKMNCPTKCIDVDVGTECLETKNGTCTLSQPKIVECGRKIVDPDCKERKSDCESKIKDSADNVTKVEEEVKSIRSEMDEQKKEAAKVFESAPDKCKQLRLKRRKRR